MSGKRDFVPFEMLRKQWQTVVLKLIRRKLSEQEKKQVQSRFKPYLRNISCEECGGGMYSEYYKGVHGYEYRIEDRLGNGKSGRQLKVEQKRAWVLSGKC